MEGETKREAGQDHDWSPLSVEFGIRLIEQLVTNGSLSQEDALAIYENSLASISNSAPNEAALLILEAISRQGRKS